MIIIYVYFVHNKTTTPNKEKSVGGKKIKHNILSFKKLSHVILHMIM